MSLERDAANHFGVCPVSGRSGGGMKVRNRGGSEACKTRGVTCLGCRFALSDVPGGSGPVSLSVVSTVMTRLLFPLPLVGSSRWRGSRASTERSLADESNSTRRLRGRLLRVFLIFSKNQRGEYRRYRCSELGRTARWCRGRCQP